MWHGQPGLSSLCTKSLQPDVSAEPQLVARRSDAPGTSDSLQTFPPGLLHKNKTNVVTDYGRLANRLALTSDCQRTGLRFFVMRQPTVTHVPLQVILAKPADFCSGLSGFMRNYIELLGQ